MNEPIRVLVTGVGGVLGQALVKALLYSAQSIVCHGCDMDGNGVGGVFVDNFHIVPRADDPTYVRVLDDLCGALAIHAVIPGSEQEICVLGHLGTPSKLPCGVPIICQEGRWIDTYGDKLSCMKELQGKIELVPFADGSDGWAVSKLVSEAGFPLVIKSRTSSGSRSIRFANNEAELESGLRSIVLPLVQAYVDASGGEFSVGVFVCEYFCSAIAFQRELGPAGCSWYAETSRDDAVLLYARRIVECSGLRGSVNIQLRKSREGVRLIEINPRFSSLVAARAACGFRDAEWSVELALGRTLSRPGHKFKHIRFRRFFHELIDFGEGFGPVSEWSLRGKRHLK